MLHEVQLLEDKEQVRQDRSHAMQVNEYSSKKNPELQETAQQIDYAGF
jgi:hypothetical protein